MGTLVWRRRTSHKRPEPGTLALEMTLRANDFPGRFLQGRSAVAVSRGGDDDGGAGGGSEKDQWREIRECR